MWDYSKLKGRMREKGLRQEDVGAAAGMRPATFSLKLNSKGEFRLTEIEAICQTLDISMDEISGYFFEQKV